VTVCVSIPNKCVRIFIKIGVNFVIVHHPSSPVSDSTSIPASYAASRPVQRQGILGSVSAGKSSTALKPVTAGCHASYSSQSRYTSTGALEPIELLNKPVNKRALIGVCRGVKVCDISSVSLQLTGLSAARIVEAGFSRI
jgi:hypothetical protein